MESVDEEVAEMTEKVTELLEEAPEPKVTRRDMIDIEREVAKAFPEDRAAFSDLFPDGKATAKGALAMAFIQERKSGETDKSFGDWLDEEVDLDEEEEGDSDGSGDDPT